MKNERRYVKEPGIIVCHCECAYNKKCPAPNGNPCKNEWLKIQAEKHQPIIIRID